VLENDQWRPLRPTGIKSGAVTGLLQQRGRWWIGTQQGLFRELRPGRWKRYSLGTGLDDPWVTALAEWRGKLWVGTFAGGLSVFERERWKRVPIPGLRQVTSLIAGDRLWAAGTEHVYVQEGTRWRELGASDGLASAGAYTLGCVNGQAIVASTGGVAFERP
jgi:ligand-binding sensor domain-containing protein